MKKQDRKVTFSKFEPTHHIHNTKNTQRPHTTYIGGSKDRTVLHYSFLPMLRMFIHYILLQYDLLKSYWNKGR